VDDAARICARLMAAGAIPRIDLPELEHPVIRDEVESRLRQCGFQLASSVFSDYYGVRLAQDSASDGLDAPSNLGLGANACALLTILWAKLALQKRTASQKQVVPDAQGELIAEQRRDRVREYQPSVRYETLAREFGSKLGGRTRLRGLLGQLRRLKFITYRRLDEIQAGPLLELAIDGEKMVGFIRSRVLNRYLESAIEEPAADEIPENRHDRLLQTFAQSEQPLSIMELETRSGLARRELKRMLKLMRENLQIESVGVGSKTTYRLRPAKL
jgi:hypothetical protein